MIENDLVSALRAIARVQTDLIAEGRRQRQQEQRMINVLRGICEHLEIELPDTSAAQESVLLPQTLSEIEMLESLLKLSPPPETNLG